uniref:Uncharacterized protein n=1 Tax=Rhizophora mucronata TaxID=61149 RepID=A0A2P2NKC7_RHIMU
MQQRTVFHAHLISVSKAPVFATEALNETRNRKLNMKLRRVMQACFRRSSSYIVGVSILRIQSLLSMFSSLPR